MGRFNIDKLKPKEEKKDVEIGKTYLNAASIAQRDTRKKTEYIAIDDIVLNEDNNMSMDDIDKLKQSILTNGLLQPLVVEQMTDGRYKLYVGHRRITAIRELRSEGKWTNDTVEAKVIDLDELPIPEGVSRKTRERMTLRGANIVRNKTDADKLVEVQDWKEVYADLRANGVEVWEFGEGDEAGSQQIKGVKTQKLIAESMGVSPAYVAQVDKITNQGSDELIEAVKSGKMSVSAAAGFATRTHEDQKKILSEIASEKITTKDINKAEKKKEEKPKEEATMVITKDIVENDIKKILDELFQDGEEKKVTITKFNSYNKCLKTLAKLLK